MTLTLGAHAMTAQHLMTAAMAAGQGQDSALGIIGQWVIDIVATMGQPGLWLLVLAENVIPIVPSEIILPLAGLAASQGAISLPGAIIGSTIASVLGAYIWYFLGRLLGHDRTVAIARRIPLFDADDIDTTTAWFAKHGDKAVFFGRMVPFFRVLISIPAGIERMSWVKFGVLSLIGSGIWNAIFVLAGFYLGEQWTVILEYSHILQWIVLAAIVVLVAWWIVAKVRKRRRRAAEGAVATAPTASTSSTAARDVNEA